MKAAGIASLLIGLVGLAVITYFYLQATQEYNALEELQDLASLYTTMSNTTRTVLFILETVGAVLGFLAYKRGKVKTGLLGLGLCMLNLIFLYF